MRRVVIADDALLLRQGAKAVLATLEGVEVVAEADDHPSLMAAVDEHRPPEACPDRQQHGHADRRLAACGCEPHRRGLPRLASPARVAWPPTRPAAARLTSP